MLRMVVRVSSLLFVSELVDLEESVDLEEVVGFGDVEDVGEGLGFGEGVVERSDVLLVSTAVEDRVLLARVEVVPSLVVAALGLAVVAVVVLATVGD